MLKKLGYDKNVPLEFNNKRSCGLWLLLIGSVILCSVITSGKFLMNPYVFMIGYYVCFYVSNINRNVREKLSQGSCSRFQIRIILVGLAVLFVLMFFIAGPFIPSWRWRMIWLGVMLATSIHFLIFYFVHGKSMLFISIMCSLVAVCGYIFNSVPFFWFGLVDGLIKVGFGSYLLFFSRPTKSLKSSVQTETIY